MSDQELRKGMQVHVWSRPEEKGVVTGERRTTGSKEYVEVDFGGKRIFEPESILEISSTEASLEALIERGEYSGPSELQRILVHTKISGDLTNILYSMESSQTDFYPHQFKPVLKFLDSPNSRLLIADEVGLGKTIEALYIWKELQAREQASRLLIVCPAMLRTKWEADLRRRFGIRSQAVNAKGLLSLLKQPWDSSSGNGFVVIASLEAIRTPSDYLDENNETSRARLGRQLEDSSASSDASLFDLVIIDEAHYLRNPGTANQRLGQLLRDASQHLVLLTATPIQIRSENLFHLLRIVDPERFVSLDSFDELIKANAPIIKSQRALWKTPPDVRLARTILEEAVTGNFHKGDDTLDELARELQNCVNEEQLLTAERRLEMIGHLESRSLIGDYLTRNRKREVFKDRVVRKVQSPTILFSAEERSVYNRVSRTVKEMAAKTTGMAYFALIARQRQMASCMVAALSAWGETGYLQELLWQDLGTPAVLDIDKDEGQAIELGKLDFYSPELQASLERNDSKYSVLNSVLKEAESYDPSGKVVIFAFYRGTLEYLYRRLTADGFPTYLIMGGMGEEKDRRIREFQEFGGKAILLSSEVGSEGIDLQFCSSLINYDLPWNPMRVEQRIGRLDRIGQKAESISITNLYHEDSIEDRILSRLYDRIEVFRDSIGDLEDILGSRVDKLMLNLYNPKITAADRERMLEEEVLVLLKERKERKILESEAINLVSFGDYILEQVNMGRSRGHWISAYDYYSYVQGFLSYHYPDTVIVREEGNSFESSIGLSMDARIEFETFLQGMKVGVHTRLHRSNHPVKCTFDPKITKYTDDTEHIHVNHPLVRWIQQSYKSEVRKQGPPIVAIHLPQYSESKIHPGVYVFLSQVWEFSGLVTERQLSFTANSISDSICLTAQDAESLIFHAASDGRPYLQSEILSQMSPEVQNGLSKCMSSLATDYETKERAFEDSNQRRCNQQIASANGHADRLASRLKETIEKYKVGGNEDMIHLPKAKLERVKQELEVRLKSIEMRRHSSCHFRDLCAGVIILEG